MFLVCASSQSHFPSSMWSVGPHRAVVCIPSPVQPENSERTAQQSSQFNLCYLMCFCCASNKWLKHIKLDAKENALLLFPCCLSTQACRCKMQQSQWWRESRSSYWFSLSLLCVPCCWHRGQAAPAALGDIKLCCMLIHDCVGLFSLSIFVCNVSKTGRFGGGDKKLGSSLVGNQSGLNTVCSTCLNICY